MRISRTLACLALALASVAAPLAAHADRFYTDRAEFTAQLVDPLMDTYDCGGCSFEYLGTGVAELNGVGYVNAGSGNIFRIGSFYGDANPAFTAHDFLQSESGTLFLLLPGAARSLGFDAYSLFADAIYQLTIDTVGGAVVVAAGGTGFLGVTSDTPFTAARIDVVYFSDTFSSPGIVQIDNLTGSADIRKVPAPPAGVLLLAGGIALLALRRRSSIARLTTA